MGAENILKMGMSGVSTLKAGHSIPAEPELGRFISRDPIGFAGGLNLFGTAFGNNPLTNVDPEGLNVYVWIREQDFYTENASEWGHAWVEVDDPCNPGKRFSIGAYPESLMNPEPWSVEGVRRATKEGATVSFHEKKFRLAKVYETSQKTDSMLISVLQMDWINSQVGRSITGNCPYYKTPMDTGSMKVEDISVCTTFVCRFLRATGVDPTIPDIVQPNNLWNYYHPEDPLREGGIPGAPR